MADRKRLRINLIFLCLLLILLLIPLLGETFYTRWVTRMMIYATLALSLDLILGYGGMVSFGHAAFFGVGAYVVGILARHGISDALLAWPMAAACAALAAVFIGAVSLRTVGAYFIMITLAFAQMLYYFFFGLEAYGGSDGMPLLARNNVAGLTLFRGHAAYYYLVLAIMVIVYAISARLVDSRFGLVIQGIRENERRMVALGYATYRYKLTCFAISAAIAGLAGALIANQAMYISPSLLHWTQSGQVLVMVILGGMGSLLGPMAGAMALLLAEEILSGYTQHWMILLGPTLILMVLFARRGLYGLIAGGGSNGR